MQKMIIVSNRLPISISKTGENIKVKKSVGGLATGLGSFYKDYKAVWIGWPGVASERIRGHKTEIRELLDRENCIPVFLSQKDVEKYYYGFSNKTLWPLFHYFTQYVIYDDAFWKTYQNVNKEFAKAVLQVADKDDLIWVHDYQLMLLPMMIRRKLPDNPIGFFLHIPFPSFEVFRALPWRKEIIEGLLGADLIGFHTYDYATYFLDSVRRLFGYESTLGKLSFGDRIVKVDAFPMGIDYEKFANASKDPLVQKSVRSVKRTVGERKVILSVDRMDYTKGILQRLNSYDEFLDRYPQYKGKVTMILVAVPSRSHVEQYARLKMSVDEKVGAINGKHGMIDWTPIHYLYRSLPFNRLTALYLIADVAPITPLRDGMNLVAKEFIATKTDGKGVLILSEMAGAAKELDGAIIVNPNSDDEMVEALKEALEMPVKEQIERNRMMQQRLKRYTVTHWAEDFIKVLGEVKEMQRNYLSKRLTDEVAEKITLHFKDSKERLLLLDYDGTLIPFASKPSYAKPDKKLIRLLRELAQKSEVVIVSGRDKDTLEHWFGKLPIGLIGEHGVWIKEKNGNWREIAPLENEWKSSIRPILEYYVDRTPGSFIEEKPFSLVWHYRNVQKELAITRVGELKSVLANIAMNLGVEILDGNKVLEFKNAGINKGRAALHFISKRKWDFLLAAGDDVTDEDLFEVLPEYAYSIKVRRGVSLAKYDVESHVQVRALLERFIKS
jgi:trehalose 6-phosphate synthase/phosphatase